VSNPRHLTGQAEPGWLLLRARRKMVLADFGQNGPYRDAAPVMTGQLQPQPNIHLSHAPIGASPMVSWETEGVGSQPGLLSQVDVLTIFTVRPQHNHGVALCPTATVSGIARRPISGRVRIMVDWWRRGTKDHLAP